MPEDSPAEAQRAQSVLSLVKELGGPDHTGSCRWDDEPDHILCRGSDLDLMLFTFDQAELQLEQFVTLLVAPSGRSQRDQVTAQEVPPGGLLHLQATCVVAGWTCEEYCAVGMIVLLRGLRAAW